MWVACRRRVYILFARLANVRPLLVPLHRASASSKNCKTEDSLFILFIIIPRPKQAYGRQGLAGSWGQDTDQVGTFLGVLNHENQPETLKNYKNRPGTMKNQPGANNFQKKKIQKKFFPKKVMIFRYRQTDRHSVIIYISASSPAS